MTREEKLGINIVAGFVLFALVFYALIAVPRIANAPALSHAAALSAGADIEPGILPIDAQPAIGNFSGRCVDQATREPLTAKLAVLGISHIARPDIEVHGDGTFAIDGLPVGTPIQVRAQTMGYAERVVDFRFERGTQVDLGELMLSRLVRLEGRVLDALERPVRGARVTLYRSLPSLSALDLVLRNAKPLGEVLTSQSGDFSLDEITAPTLDVMVESKEAGRVLMRGVVLGKESRRHLRMRLAPGLPLETAILDTTGQPLAGAIVALEPLTHHQPWLTSVTDERGVLRVDALAPGTYRVAAWHAGNAAVLGLLECPTRATTSSLRMPAPAPALAKDLAFSVRVANAKTNLPIEGAAVLAEDSATPLALSSTAGMASGNAVAGTRLLVGARAHHTVPLDPGAHDVALTACRWIEAHVSFDHGESVPRALLECDWRDGEACVSDDLLGEADASGSVFLPVHGKRIAMRVSSEERTFLGTWEGNVPDAGALFVRVPRPATLVGTLTNKAGQPIANAIVWMTLAPDNPAAPLARAQTRTNAQGSYLLMVPAGIEQARLRAQCGAAHGERELPTTRAGMSIVSFDVVLDS